MNDFSSTLRSLSVDRGRSILWGLAVCGLLLGLWALWLFGGRVAVVERSPARLEVAQMAHVIAAAAEGRVVALRARLGEPVARGAPLIELESEQERLRLAEEQSRLRSSGPELQAIERQLATLRGAEGADTEGAAAALEEARFRAERADAQARLRESESQALTGLGPGVVTQLEVLRVQTEAQKERSEAQALAAEVRRLEGQQGSQRRDREARLLELQQRLLALSGEQEKTRATIARLQYEIERRTIRAEVDGRVAELQPLQVGSVVRAGDRLGSILPAGELRAVALFEPRAALGRVHPGQRGVLRLDGFPWAQFGSVAVEVMLVASEIRDGHVRVELSVQRDPRSAIPLQHGLPGVVELEVEEARPLALLLRAAGRMVQTTEGPGAAPPLVGGREGGE